MSNEPLTCPTCGRVFDQDTEDAILQAVGKYQSDELAEAKHQLQEARAEVAKAVRALRAFAAAPHLLAQWPSPLGFIASQLAALSPAPAVVEKEEKPPSDDPCIKCHYRLDKTGVGYCYKCIEMAAVEREERK
jgi:hypothetical protein